MVREPDVSSAVSPALLAASAQTFEAPSVSDQPVTREHAVSWVNAYGEAWQAQDADKILRLYTEDAVYVERPYDPEGGIYRGHAGIREYWETHISKRERDIKFRQFEEDLAYDPETRTATAKWEARFSVVQRSRSNWKNVQFLQVAVLRFAPDGRVRHFEEWWHARHLQRAAKGLRDPKARRPRAGPKRRMPDMGGRTCAHDTLFRAALGPFERDGMKLGARNKTKPHIRAKEEATALATEENECEVKQSARRRHMQPIISTALRLPAEVPPRSLDIIEWYRQTLFKAELVEESEVSGVPMLRPHGAFLWEELRAWLDGELASLGMMPFRPPTLTHHAEEETQENLENRGKSFLEVRTSTEALLYTAMAKRWIQSTRDLPLVLKRWGVAVSPDPVKRPLPFLRSRELPWQEGYAMHARAMEAESFARAVQRIYVRLCEEVLAVAPEVRQTCTSLGVSAQELGSAQDNVRTEQDDDNISKQLGQCVLGKVSIEVPVYRSDVNAEGEASHAVEVASVHQLGCSTATAFKIRYDAVDAECRPVKRTPFQTCFSATSRAVGAALCAHGDDRGLVLPPRLAPIQAVLIPVASGAMRGKQANQSGVVARHLQWCESAAALLRIPEGSARTSSGWASLPLRVQIDGRTDWTPGKRIRAWLLRGVPLLILVRLESPETQDERHELEERSLASVRVLARDSLDADRDDSHILSPANLAQVVRENLVSLQSRLLERHRGTKPAQGDAEN